MTRVCLVFGWLFLALGTLAIDVYAQTCPGGPGCLDPTFGNGGIVLTSFNANTISNWANDVAIQPSDGKIVAAVRIRNYENTDAADFYVLRYDTSGALDPSFGSGGVVRFAFNNIADIEAARSVAIQPDGKIVVAGAVTTNNLAAVTRLNPDGSLDTSFGTGGKTTFQFAARESAVIIRIALQSNGRIILGGQSGDGNALFARLNSNGTLDTSFNGSGKVSVSVTQKNGTPNGALLDIAVQPDGKIVGAGVKGGANRGPRGYWMVMRLNANGTLDNSFGSGGFVVDQFAGTWSSARNVSVLSDGRILAGGDWLVSPNSSYVYIQYLPNGQLDPSFGSSGKSIISAGGEAGVEDMVVQSDGKIVGAGHWRDVNTSNSNVLIMRLLSNGTLDAGFGSSGVVYTDYIGFYDSGNRMAIQPDGKYVVAGEIYVSQNPSIADIGMLRYLP